MKSAFMAELKKHVAALPGLVTRLDAIHDGKFVVHPTLDRRTLDHALAVVDGLTALAMRCEEKGAAFRDPEIAALMARQRAAVAQSDLGKISV